MNTERPERRSQFETRRLVGCGLPGRVCRISTCQAAAYTYREKSVRAWHWARVDQRIVELVLTAPGLGSVSSSVINKHQDAIMVM